MTAADRDRAPGFDLQATPRALAAALEKLAASSDTREQLAAAGHRHVLESFSVTRHVGCIQDVYDECLAGKSP